DLRNHLPDYRDQRGFPVTRFLPKRRRPGAPLDPDDGDLLVQNRPTLGGLNQERPLVGWWLLPIVDLPTSTLILPPLLLLAGASLVPAFPLAPLLCVVASAALGAYASHHEVRGHRGDGTWPVARILVATLFAWCTGLFASVSVGAQLILWAAFIVVDFAARRL